MKIINMIFRCKAADNHLIIRGLSGDYQLIIS